MSVAAGSRELRDLATTPAQDTLAPVRSAWPRYGDDEIAAVHGVLRSGQVNALVHGEKCRRFEAAFAGYIGVSHAIAVANGTLALELGLRALGVGPDDEVIVTARSYFASVSCIVALGARPVFADVDPVSQNIDPEAIEAAITSATKAVICVHLAGWPCDMPRIVDICRRHKLKLVEDCAQALGAAIDQRRVGSFGDAAAFSFCTDKILSTGGEGGMLVMRDRAVWSRAWSYKDHGKDHDKVVAPTTGGTFRWLHESFGSNYRLTEMQAAIGLLQLGKLPAWLTWRKDNAAVLDAALAGHPRLRLARPPANIDHAYYKYYAFLRDTPRGDDGAARDALVARLQAMGVPCGSGSCPEMYRERAFAGTGWAPTARLSVARTLGATSIMLPVDPTLSVEDMAVMAERIVRALEG